MTRVYVQPTGRRIAPFDDPVSEVPVANRPLGAWLDDALAGAGLTRIDALEPPCLVVPDTLFTTAGALRAFVDGAAGRDAVLGLTDSVFGERTTPVQPGVARIPDGWRFDAVRFVSGRDEEAVVVWVDPEEERHALELPRPFREPGRDEISLPRHPVMTVHHWVHVLWANQAAGAAEARARPRWQLLFQVLWALARTVLALQWPDKWRILGRMNRIGRGCDIHPTAVVEGSTLADGVTVGPHARVLFSRLGEGATVMPGALVELSTLGARAAVAQYSAVRLCVLHDDAFCSQQMMQASVVGRDVLTTVASYCIDLNLERTVRVPLDGAMHDTGTRFLGSAIGHRSVLGTGVWVASGRAIPNDTVLVKDPGEVLARPEPLDGPATIRDGRMVDPSTPRSPR